VLEATAKEIGVWKEAFQKADYLLIDGVSYVLLAPPTGLQILKH